MKRKDTRCQAVELYWGLRIYSIQDKGHSYKVREGIPTARQLFSTMPAILMLGSSILTTTHGLGKLPIKDSVLLGEIANDSPVRHSLYHVTQVDWGVKLMFPHDNMNLLRVHRNLLFGYIHTYWPTLACFNNPWFTVWTNSVIWYTGRSCCYLESKRVQTNTVSEDQNKNRNITVFQTQIFTSPTPLSKMWVQ